MNKNLFFYFIFLLIVSLILIDDYYITYKYYSIKNNIFLLRMNNSKYKNTISILNVKLNNLTWQYKKNISSLLNRINYEKEEINYDKKIINAKLKQYKKAKPIIYPSFSILKNFIKEDNTNERRYINNNFTCMDFSDTLIKNFRKISYYACTTIIYFKKGAHALVAVNTTDKGIYYVEPQTDAIFKKIWISEDYLHDKLHFKASNNTITKIADCFRG